MSNSIMTVTAIVKKTLKNLTDDITIHAKTRQAKSDVKKVKDKWSGMKPYIDGAMKILKLVNKATDTKSLSDKYYSDGKKWLKLNEKYKKAQKKHGNAVKTYNKINNKIKKNPSLKKVFGGELKTSKDTMNYLKNEEDKLFEEISLLSLDIFMQAHVLNMAFEDLIAEFI